jgi:hypothetical protein
MSTGRGAHPRRLHGGTALPPAVVPYLSARFSTQLLAYSRGTFPRRGMIHQWHGALAMAYYYHHGILHFVGEDGILHQSSGSCRIGATLHFHGVGLVAPFH